MSLTAGKQLLLTSAAAASGYAVSRSLRFNSSDSAYLSRTPASAGTSRRIFTLSLWFKRGTSSDGTFFSAGGDSDPAGYLAVSFSSDSINTFVRDSTTFRSATTTAVFRDYSAWYHLVYSVDTTQTTFATQQKLYINGTQITTWSASPVINQNTDLLVNHTNANDIGAARSSAGAAVSFFDGYMADVHMVDGQALDPTSFGEFDATTGVWNPKAYAGTYGTNGFRLTFADNSAATATTLGKDAAGSNNWTPTNLSVTAGAGNDSLVDVPTNGSQTDTGVGGEVRGNYCTWLPLYAPAVTTSNGNLEATVSTTTAYGSFSFSSGKWYWEILVSDVGGSSIYIGVMDSTFLGTGSNWSTQARSYVDTGSKYDGTTTSYGSSYTTNDIIGVAIDLDSGTIAFYKNGVSQGTAFSDLAGKTWRPFVYSGGASTTQIANFGQRAFAYTAPSGFKALCTANLPAPTIVKPNTVMDVVTYTGTGSALTPTSTLGFNPDLVWIKSRSAATDHAWYDAVRGAEKRLESNNTDAEVTSDGGVTAFNTAGFSVGTLAQVNTNAATYAAWAWDAGSSTVTNTQGSISSQVRANATAGFSIVTFTTPSSDATNFTVGHGLNVAPSLIVCKDRNNAEPWYTFHSAATSISQYLRLNTTNGVATSANAWGAALPTSSVFGCRTTGLFYTSASIVAYCFAPVAGYSAFGSYTGNGSSDGPMVFTGFRPRWIMIKRTDTAGYDWFVIDTARSTYNTANDYLAPNSSTSENGFGSATFFDILSNGFKLRTDGPGRNASGGTYVYAAFAESPFNYSRAR